MLLVRGKTTLAVPLLWRGRVHAHHGDGAGHPQAHPGNLHRAQRALGMCGSQLCGRCLAALVFVGQIVGKWAEGGWVVLISFSMLVLAANAMLTLTDRLSRARSKSTASCARKPACRARWHRSWSGSRCECRNTATSCSWAIAHAFFEIFGVRRPLRYEPAPVPAGDYDHAVHVDHPEAPSLLEQYLDEPEAAKPEASDQPAETSSTDPEQDI